MSTFKRRASPFKTSHLWYGSPEYPTGHVHVGRWLTTVQIAIGPHVPGHGSWHLLRIQDLLGTQSVLTVHSGRHPSYGFPI